MSLALAHVTFDCADAAALSSFWSAALGRPVDEGAAPYFAAIGFQPPVEGTVWMFIQVPEGKSAKNRLHLDLVSDGRDAEVARLVALGASELGEHDEWGHQWTVMADPEGNEFCVS